MPHVAFVTYQQSPAITADDQLAACELRTHGIQVTPVVWDAPTINWSHFDCVVIRSAWDYHLKADRYVAWLQSFRGKQTLWNPAPAVLDNISKQYLLSLAAQGFEVVPTVMQTAGDGLSLSAALSRCQWDDVVIKPAVSASGRGTWRTSHATIGDDEARFAEQVQEQDVLIQPYIPEIATAGEWSLVFIDGRYSHAALKRPARGEFRVQLHLGGMTERAEPGAQLIAHAEAILATIPHPLLYARVDGIERCGRLLLMELEINEPFLFLGYAEQAAEKLARGIVNRL
jgi:glutathione synthase/RimK-type ligase-like ATP-grasp enzyme